MKKGFKENIEQATLDNSDFRRVLYTGKHSQLVLMALLPKEEIGLEIHPHNDQFFRFEKGQGKVIINDTFHDVGAGTAVIVPAGAEHNIINVSDIEPLKFYTIYSPAHHKDKIVGRTKQEAEQSDIDFDGITTE
ncbi:MAG: cupin domain-containing protein [Parcubacteria group bacterium]